MTLKTGSTSGLLLAATLTLSVLSSACITPQRTATGALSRLGEARAAEQCDQTRSGGLSVAFGAMWFTPDARPDAQGQPLQSPPVLLAGPSGGLSDIIPHINPGQALIARQSLEVSEESRVVQPPQLLSLDTQTLELKMLWNAPLNAQNLRLLGRIGQRALVTWATVDAQGQLQHQAASVPLDGQGAATEPIILQGSTSISGEPEQGATRWVVAPTSGALFVLDAWPDGRLSASEIKSSATSAQRLSATEVLLRWSPTTCAIAPLDSPDLWSALTPSDQGCDVEPDLWAGPLLDGQPAPLLVASTPPACATRDEVFLPELGPAENGALTAPVSLAPMPIPPDAQAAELTLRLLVRGQRLFIEYLSDNNEVAEADWRLPLPPETITLQPVMLEGQPFYEAMINVDVPINPWSSCERGTLRVVAAGPGDAAQRAVLEQEVSFGMCEQPETPQPAPAP